MYPTVRSGDLVIIDHLSSIENGGIQRGDVVCAFTPDSLVAVVKRLIALVGGVFECADCVVHLMRNHAVAINTHQPGDRIRVNPDERFEQPIYTTVRSVCVRNIALLYFKLNYLDLPLLQIPRGHVWLAGDNPPQSSDSRQYGPLPQALVSGRPCARGDLCQEDVALISTIHAALKQARSVVWRSPFSSESPRCHWTGGLALSMASRTLSQSIHH